MDNLFSKIKLGERFTFTISYILISTMMVCVAISFIQFTRRIFPGWNGDYIIPLVIIISLERLINKQRIDALEAHQRWIYNIAEWISIAVILKIFFYFNNGFDRFIVDIFAWQSNFLVFLEGEYIPVLALLLLCWFLSASFASHLEDLRVDQMDLRWEVGILENRRLEAREGIMNNILWLGMAMVFAAVLTRLDVKALFGPFLAYQAPVINILVYFLGALLLFSQTQYSLLRGRWLWHQVSLPPKLESSWLKYGLLFFIFLTILAFLLPTGYTFGLLEVLRFILSALIQIVLVIVAILSLPLGWLLSLLKGSPQPQDPAPPVDFTDALPQRTQQVPDPILQLIQNLLFWLVLIGIIVFSMYTFLHQNANVFSAIKGKSGWDWLLKVIRNLKHWLQDRFLAFEETLTVARQFLLRFTSNSQTKTSIRFPNFQQLTPRERVVFFYLRTLEKAKAQGIIRKPAQTPAQFSSVMEKEFTDVQSEINDLTASFQEARYSRHHIPAETSNHAQHLWNRIAQAIRKYKNPSA